jgi:hypothetical protein
MPLANAQRKPFLPRWTEGLARRNVLSGIRIARSPDLRFRPFVASLPCLEFREVPFLLELDDHLRAKSFTPDMTLCHSRPEDLPFSHLRVRFLVPEILGKQTDC